MSVPGGPDDGSRLPKPTGGSSAPAAPVSSAVPSTVAAANVRMRRVTGALLQRGRTSLPNDEARGSIGGQLRQQPPKDQLTAVRIEVDAVIPELDPGPGVRVAALGRQE